MPPCPAGLLGSKKSKSWKVTAKKGGPAAAGGGGADGGGGAAPHWRLKHKPYMLELGLATYYASMSGVAFWRLNWMMGAYCAIMATVFVALSFGDYFL